MRRKESEQHIASLTPEARIEIARRRQKELVNQILSLIGTSANNEIINFTDTLTSQVPESRAAHAFNDFQRTMFLGEIVRICALWDPLDFEKISVPTIYALIDDEAVQKRLFRDMLRHYFDRGGHFSDFSSPRLSPEMY